MRNRLLGVLAVVVVVGIGIWAIAASGDDSDSDSDSGSEASAESSVGGEVTLWIMDNGPDPVGDTERILKPFEDETGIDVKVQLVGWDVQFDRIRNAAISGRGPCVTQAGTTQVPFFAAVGGFDDLSDRVEEIGGEDAYAPGIWATTQVEGQEGTWAVPWFTEARTVYYRKDALAEAGVDEKTAFTDWESFKATLEALSEVEEIDGKPIKPFGSPGRRAFDLVHHVMPFVWNNGGAELAEDNSESTINSTEAVEGVKWFADLIPAGLYDETALERDATQVEETFKGGQIAVWIGGPWVLSTVEREDDPAWSDAARENVGIAPMPAGPSGEASAFVGGSNLMMFESCENKEAAWELIEYLSEDQVQTDYASLMGMFPSRLQPQQAQGEESPNHAAFAEAIENGRTYAPIPQWGQIETAYQGRFGNILEAAAGRGSEEYSEELIQSELEAAKEEADALLAQNAG
jgi:multiple sugar transport system substrate-binding protein